MEDTAELESILRSLLVSSPKVMKLHRLESDYYETEGRHVPFRKLGFSTFLDYLKSIPHVVQLVPDNSPNPDVLPIVTKEISHIDKLVSKQRTTVPSRKRSSSRRGGSFRGRYNSAPSRRRPPANYSLPEPRPPPNKVPTSIDPDFMRTILWELVKTVAISRNNGIYVSELESHIKSKYSREDLQNNGILSVHDLLSKANGMVDHIKDKVFPNLSSTSATTSKPIESHTSCIPAGMEEEFDEESDNEDSNIYYNMKYDEAAFEGIEEETVSNYTIQRCTESLLSSKKNVKSTKGSTYDIAEDYSPDDHEANFSERMIRNFRSILSKYPDGVWATELPQKYFEEFRVSLDIQSLGYTSAVEMASYLPNVFKYVRVGSHDWKLFDPLLYSENDHVNKLPLQVEEIHLKGQFEQKNVPKSILENITQLLDQRPEGIRSIDLLYFYEREYHKKLDIETLGFKTLEDFIEHLKELITVRKATGHYLLLPKHKTVSLDMIKAESEELKLPLDSYKFLGPEHVMKPNDVIPPQELPPVNLKDPEEPLMTMEVRLGEIINPSLFYLLLDSQYNELQSMMDDLENFYKQEEQNYKIPLPYLTEGLYCACKYEGFWHRAIITGIRKNGTINIEFIDYGTPAKVHESELRLLQTDFGKLPTQSICAKLIGVAAKSEDGKWPKDACLVFHRMVLEKRILAQVYRVNTNKNKDERVQLEVILFDTSGQTDVILNEHLVEQGYAEFIKKAEKEEEIPLDQIFTSTVSQQSPAVQTNDVKRPPRIPPGFEACFNSAQVQNQETWYSPKDISQVGNSYAQTPPVQQHWQINNILLAPYENNLRQIQSLFQNPHLFNIPQLQYQGSQPNIGWPQMPPVLTTNYIPNAPVGVQNLCFPTLNSSQIYNQPHSYEIPTEVNPNSQNIKYQNKSANYGHNKIPGYSGDLSMPLQSPLQHMAASSSSYQQRAQLAATTSSLLVEVDQDGMNRTNFLKTPPSVTELLPRLSDNKSKYENPQLAEYVDNSELFKKEINMKLNSFDDISSNKDKLNLPQFTKMKTESVPEPLPILNNITSKYDKSEYADNSVLFKKEVNMTINKFDDARSNKDILETQNFIDPQFSSVSDHISSVVDSYESKKATQLSDNLQSLTLINDDCESAESVIENWEDLDIDDTPAKADNFSINFKTSVNSIRKDVKNALSNQYSGINLSPNTQKINKGSNLLLQSNKLQVTTNWKDMFDPDRISYSERNNTINKINTPFEKNSLEKKLIKKLEFKDTFFHVLQVNNKYAVFSEEFFPQFIKMKWTIIYKVVDLKNISFDVICKQTNPELFNELEEIELCGGINKKWRLKIGKTFISYISKIPSVFSVFNIVPDPDLLLILKDYEHLSPAT